MPDKYKNIPFLFEFVIILLCSAGMIFADSLELKPRANGDILLSLTLPEDIQIIPVEEDYLIQIDGYTGHADSGMPDLPVLVTVLDGKPNESMEVKLLPCEYLIITQNIDIAAVATRETIALDPPNSVTRNVRKKNDAIYSRNIFWPEKQVEVTEAWQGNRKLLRIAIYPVQYNPISKVLRACRKLEAILKTVPSTDEEGPRGPIRPRQK
jgi:hypothetical protein